MRLKIALETHKLKLAEQAARKLAEAGTLNDTTLADALSVSPESAKRLRKRLQAEKRYPGKPPRPGRPRRHPPESTDWARRVARMRSGSLTELESRAITVAVELAGEHGTVPIPELADRLGLTHSKAGRIYTALKQAGLCRWPGSGWTKARDSG